MVNEAFLTSLVVYMKGEYLPFEKATLSVASSPVQYGLAVYTACNVTLCGQQLVGFRLTDHYQRLVRSANILGMTDFSEHYSFDAFISIIKKLLRQNKTSQEVIVRLTYYVDGVMSGTKIHDQPTGLAAFLLPFGDYFSKPTLDVCVSSWRRLADDAMPARAKITGSYVNSSLMKSEALLNGYDDCISLNSHGHVAEGAVANIFMVRDNELITPSKSSDILEGITRDTVIRIAREKGIAVLERTIDKSELYIADELFFSGSSARICPIVSVDKRKIGNLNIGKMTKQIMDAYAQVQHKKLVIENSWYTNL